MHPLIAHQKNQENGKWKDECSLSFGDGKKIMKRYAVGIVITY